MTKINDSGPEFPAAFGKFAGWSMRDYVAIHAPITLMDAAIACGWDGVADAKTSNDASRAVLYAMLYTMCYEYADAFIARSGGQEDE